MAMKKLNRISPSHEEAPNPHLLNILYVEDENSNWNVTELHLKHEYHLKRARNSQETFERLRHERFDLILLDIQLSGSELDGIEICKVLKKQPGQFIPADAGSLSCCDIPVVFVTTYASLYSREKLLQAGASDVITKPVDYQRLRLLSSRLTAVVPK